MLFVDNQGITRPQINLAIEEYILRNIEQEEDLLFLYVNAPSIIVGRFQNTLEEVNQSYTEEHGIQVVRRLSGGGAVYHDLGNLNFSFITPKDPESISNFKRFAAPVIQTLNDIEVPAEMGSRNDILIRGRKVSGSAQYITGTRMISHGTLLFDSDLTRLNNALYVTPGQIASKGTKSIRSQVTNISNYLSEPMGTETFKSIILRGIFTGIELIPQYHLSEEDWVAIHRIADERYMQWEWNYGSSPDFVVHKTGQFETGEVVIQLEVHQGAIRSASIQSSLVSGSEINQFHNCLQGVRYDRRHLQLAVEKLIKFNGPMNLSSKDWLDLLF